MKSMLVCLVAGALLLGGTAAVADDGGGSRATHTVLVEFASFSW